MLTGFLRQSLFKCFEFGGWRLQRVAGRSGYFATSPETKTALACGFWKPDALACSASTIMSIKLNKPLRYKGHCSIGCRVFVKTFAAVCWAVSLPSAQCPQDTRRSHSAASSPQCPTSTRLWTAIFSPVQNELPAEAKADGAAREKSPSQGGRTTAPSACGGKARTTESQPASRQVRASLSQVWLLGVTGQAHLCEFCSQNLFIAKTLYIYLFCPPKRNIPTHHQIVPG